jgi:hypothetical protein
MRVGGVSSSVVLVCGSLSLVLLCNLFVDVGLMAISRGGMGVLRLDVGIFCEGALVSRTLMGIGMDTFFC